MSKSLPKIIWTCWFQGRDAAPPVVHACLESWERSNPGWDFRSLDARSLRRYIDLRDHIDLERQTITMASLSDILRILLLHEFGGVWVDATAFCNRPLDAWLPETMDQEFFAFEKPVPDRPLASWFLAGKPGNGLVAHWCSRTLQYWKGRRQADDYFWFHNTFRELCQSSNAARREWARVSKISAVPPHAVQFQMYAPASEVVHLVDWSTPVFKLTHRLEWEKLGRGSLLRSLLERDASVAA